MHDSPPVHAMPHPPQFAGSVWVFVQTAPHRVKPQEPLHAPPEQNWPEPQVIPQPPQFVESVWKLVQNAVAPLPQAFGVAAGQLHAPPEHCWPAGHLTPQPPQLFASMATSAQ